MRSGLISLMVTPGRSLQGELTLPGDKSLSHRAALLASLADGQSRIDHFLVAGVTHAMLDCLAQLGVEWQLDGDWLWVNGKGIQGLIQPSQPLDCGNSATTLRLLAGTLAAAGIPAKLDGSPGLRQRPMERIVTPLRQMGVDIIARDGCAPLELRNFPRPLKSIEYTLPVASAQVKSCLLLAALGADGPTTITEPGLSRDHTERLLVHMGVNLESRQLSGEGHITYSTRLIPEYPLKLKPLQFTIPGDFSSAAFLMVAALITPGSEVVLRKVGLNPTRIGLLEALWEMGADITVSHPHEQMGEPVGDLTIHSSPLHGTQVSGVQVVRMIDEFPAFAVAASFAEGATRVTQAEELRLKESDRIHQLCKELSSLGVKAAELPDGFTIQGGQLPDGGTAHAHGDHRLAMALALLGLAGKAPVKVEGAEVISESFPEFVPALQALGAEAELVS